MDKKKCACKKGMKNRHAYQESYVKKSFICTGALDLITLFFYLLLSCSQP